MFRDHFSHRSLEYAQFRPRYPEVLFADLARLAPSRSLAWDCATGSGQAAVGLATHFATVVASDASRAQLHQRLCHARVAFVLSRAEEIPARRGSVDLVSAAAAAHWFELDPFYAQVQHVLRPAGILALWSYYMFESEPAIDTYVDHLAHEILGSYWPAQIQANRNLYRSLPFPFEPLPMPEYAMRASWSLVQTLGYIETWSATQRFRAAGAVGLEDALQSLATAWGEPERKVEIRWPLHLRVARMPAT